MAKAQEPKGDVKVRILRDCVHGKCGAVVMIDAVLVESLEGIIDANPEAVAYAEAQAVQK